jgi:hypothetical protein
MSRVHRAWPELPSASVQPENRVIVTQWDGEKDVFAYTKVSELVTTVDGLGLALDTDLTDGSKDVVFNTVHADVNGTGTNFKVGDDAYIGDINVTNTLSIKGVVDGTKGYIQFGSGSGLPKIGGGGANHLNIKNIPTYPNNAAALAGGLVAGDIYIYTASDFLAIVH